MPNPNESSPSFYFLNEKHQLTPSKKVGGGGSAKLVGVDWIQHGQDLKQNFDDLKVARRQSKDPTSKSRLFIKAEPEEKIEKESAAKDAVNGKKEIALQIAGKDAQLLERLGFDLIATTDDGSAIVHLSEALRQQMGTSLDQLDSLGVREQIKWGQIRQISEVSLDYKIHLDWWSKEILKERTIDCCIDLQPLLSKAEIDRVIKKIKEELSENEKLLRIGTEFSGRVWIVAKLSSDTAIHLAESYQSIFSIHPPLVFELTGADGGKGVSGKDLESEADRPLNSLPRVALLDSGVPQQHVLLSAYLSGPFFAENVDEINIWDDHGSYVASRLVFGSVSCENGIPTDELVPKCQVLDFRLGEAANQIVDDGVEFAIRNIVATAPDIRVLNISIDAGFDVNSTTGGYRDAWLRRIADLDNLIFSNDLLVVVAAGNSEDGLLPQTSYPNHFEDPNWGLRLWSRSFNSLTCGGFVEDLSTDGIAPDIGAPSPFSRVGPGFANSPKPDFAASAGNCPETYRYKRGSNIGVWASNRSGMWDDIAGTSFAAPLLSRDAAIAFKFLENYCNGDTRPFACLVKACLALHATLPDLPTKYKKLSSVSLGYGKVSIAELEEPNPTKATFYWQGLIATEKDVLTLELPIPGAWVSEASMPTMRLFAAWDSPANHAAEDVWACRQLDITLRPEEGKLRVKNRRGSSKYTLLRREYALPQELEDYDICQVDLKYTTLGMAPNPVNLVLSPQQRVGLAYELVDLGEVPVSPHPYVQSLPVASSLNRLGLQTPASRQAIAVKIPT